MSRIFSQATEATDTPLKVPKFLEHRITHSQKFHEQRKTKNDF